MNKSFRTVFALALALCLLGSLMLPVFAEETAETEPQKEVLHIASVEEFQEFSRNCVRDLYSRGLTVSLDKDLDFTGLEFTAVPIFSGTFLGNRHTIKGITLTTEGSQQGLIRYLTETALIKDLTVSGTFLPEGSKSTVGGICGSNAGTIKGCKFAGEVAGIDSVGGIAGENLVTGIIEDCTSSGHIHGTHFIGGLVGENYGTIRKCKNLSSLNTREYDNDIESVTISADFIMGKETVDTVTDIGGIAGTTTGVIRDCVNHGNVGYPHMGYNMGGICGSQKGYAVGCKNYGRINGRKEVGGIAGQLEPVIQIAYSEDTLQILRRQLDNTSALANRASANVKGNAQYLSYDMNDLHAQAETAIDAVGTLLPSDGEWPDQDTIQAAHNTLTDSVGAMQGSVGSLNQNAQNLVSGAAADIRAITSSVNEISQTLDTAAEHLGLSIKDISDEDTPENHTGKIEDCHNAGPIFGDLNAGGIAGAVAWESDKDPEEEFTVLGNRSLNVDSEVRAVILDCSNAANIWVKKYSAGGIVGNLNLGLAKNCTNTGFVEGENADYIGGIAGSSQGFIRQCNVKCKLLGLSYVGGVAGSGSIVSDCRVTVMIDGGTERIGSVLGMATERRDDEEEPEEEKAPALSGNFYLPLADHLGAIDGIDYYEAADSLSKADFLALPDLSSVFVTATMTFQYPDGSSEKISVPLGDVVPESRIPAPPRKEGYVTKWDQLEDLDLSHMFFNVILEPQYIRTNTVLESDLQTEGGLPVMLAEGIFGEQETMNVQSSAEVPDKHNAAESWLLPNFHTEDNTVIHLFIPEAMEPDSARAMIQGADGSWREADAREDGTYLLFSVQPGDRAVTVYESSAKQISQILSLAGGILLLIVLIAAFIIVRKKKARKAKAS